MGREGSERERKKKALRPSTVVDSLHAYGWHVHRFSGWPGLCGPAGAADLLALCRVAYLESEWASAARMWRQIAGNGDTPGRRTLQRDGARLLAHSAGRVWKARCRDCGRKWIPREFASFCRLLKTTGVYWAGVCGRQAAS